MKQPLKVNTPPATSNFAKPQPYHGEKTTENVNVDSYFTLNSSDSDYSPENKHINILPPTLVKQYYKGIAASPALKIISPPSQDHLEFCPMQDQYGSYEEEDDTNTLPRPALSPTERPTIMFDEDWG